MFVYYYYYLNNAFNISTHHNAPVPLSAHATPSYQGCTKWGKALKVILQQYKKTILKGSNLNEQRSFLVFFIFRDMLDCSVSRIVELSLLYRCSTSRFVALSFYITHRVHIVLQVKGTRGKDEHYSDKIRRMYNKDCELMGFDVVIGKK